MKKVYVLLALGCFMVTRSFGQELKVVTPQEYDNLKANKQLQKNTVYFQKPGPEFISGSMDVAKQNDAPFTQRTNDACACMIPVDATFSLVPMSGYTSPFRNDDGSSNSIPLPFDFCFYGTQYSDVYINNNGNVSFGSSYSTFSSSPFPSNQYVMVAPFWGDVDTRGAGSGLVYYKMTADYLIVRWQTVGYYSNYDDKLNDFQLIISNGSDTLIPDNKNVAFCYGDMQWTTGDASSGTNGFGGVPSTVGVNKGDGTNFIQLGRFDQAGSAYDGPYGNNDGISWLDNKSFSFDACGNAGNLPPLCMSSFNSQCAFDTLKTCAMEDTLIIEAIFTAPEQNQNLTFQVSAPTLGSNVSIYSNSGSAGTDTIRAILIGNAGAVGTHTITITATDNGVPALSTALSYIIVVPNVTLPQPALSQTPPPICAGGAGSTVTLNNCSAYSSIVWSDGSTGCTANFQQSGEVFVTVSAPSGCQRTSFADIVILPNPQPTVTGTLNFCGAGGTTLGYTVSGSTSPIVSNVWTGVTPATTPTVFVTAPGTETITLTDANGCTGTATVNVSNAAPVVMITPSVTSFCPGVPVTLTSSISNGTSFTWTSSAGGSFPNSNSIVVTPVASTTYSLSVSVNGCVSNTQITLNPIVGGAVINGFNNPQYCIGQSPLIIANISPAGASTTWTPASGGPVLSGTAIVPVPGETYTVQVTVSGQCSSATQTVTAHFPTPLPLAEIATYSPGNSLAPDNVLCFKKTKVLTADYVNTFPPTVDTTGYNYAWSPASGSMADSCALVVNTAGTYILTVTDSVGCVNRDTVQIILDMPLVTVTGTPNICHEDTALIVVHGTATTPFTIDIMQNGSLVTHNDSLTTNQAGTYNIFITDTYGCIATVNSTINYYPSPVANFTAAPEPSEINQAVAFTSTSTVSSGAITQCYWNFGDATTASPQSTQNHTYTVPGTYPVQLIVKSNRGCFDTVLIDHEVYVIIPIVNIITPDNDNINNALRFNGLEFFPNSTIGIYNRWGNKIYESSNYDNKWDGNGIEAGTYYYILEVPGLKPQENKISSFFQVIR
ncbi:MAG: hypothetical protein K0S33_538 [Bacteroidetes bacterium]|jgi:gliding motility-associated-like protein|nr:hypothetical protein [Bacteroidota bacterium]